MLMTIGCMVMVTGLVTVVSDAFCRRERYLVTVSFIISLWQPHSQEYFYIHVFSLISTILHQILVSLFERI